MSPFVATKYLVRSDRLAGFPSHSAVWHSRQVGYELVRDRDFDVVFEQPGVADRNIHWLSFIHLLLHVDIWVAHFDSLIFHRDQEATNIWAFRLLKLTGIRIIVHPHGGDVIYRSRFRTRYDWVDLLQMDYPLWDLASNAEIAQRRIRLFCRFADFVIGGSWFMNPLLPRNDLLFHTLPIDCDELAPLASQPEQHLLPVIVHSPNHRNVKGTQHLIRAVERLRSLGLDSELRLIERIPRHEALELYKQADIIADQFCIGTIGIFGLEAMALGKPLMAYVDHAHLGDPVFNHPIVNSNPENLVKVLAVLLQVPELRERLGHASRESVEKYQSIPALSEVWARLYRHVWFGEPLNLETTSHFSPERKARSLSEDPSRADFWAVPVDDLMHEIHEALARAGFPSPATSLGLQIQPDGVELSA